MPIRGQESKNLFFPHSPTHPFTHSPIHPLTHSPIHPFTRFLLNHHRHDQTQISGVFGADEDAAMELVQPFKPDCLAFHD